MKDSWRGYWPPLSYWVYVTVAVVVTLAVTNAVAAVEGVLILVLIAAVVSIGLEPAVEWLQRRIRVNRTGAVFIILGSVIVFILLFAALTGPPLVKQLIQLGKQIPSFIPSLLHRDDWIGQIISQNQNDIKVFIETIPEKAVGSFGAILDITGRVTAFVYDVFTVLVLTVLFMSSMPALRRSVPKLFPAERRRDVEDLANQAVLKIGGYVSGNVITSLICFLSIALILVILRVPFALPLAMFAGLADLIPQVGGVLGVIPAVIAAFVISPVKGVIMLAAAIVYRLTEDYIIVPRVMRDAIDISVAAVLVATLVGGTLAGFVGALLALPIAATIKVLLQYAFRVREEKEALSEG